MNNKTHVFDWLPAYALGSLDPGEQAQVEAHLAGCEVCQRELQAFQGVVSELPLATPMHAAPPRLRQAILERVSQAVPQVRAADNPPRQPVSFLARVRRALAAPIPTWGLVGALVVVVALLAINVALVRRVAAVPSNDFRIIELNGTAIAPGASAWVVMSDNGQSGTLITEGLPALKPGQQYQLWLTKDGERDNGGVFTVDGSGYGSLWVYTQEPLIGYKQFGVTVEPQGGSSAPTGNKVLGGSQ